MNKERLQAIKEDLLDCEHVPELKALFCNFEAEAPDAAASPLVSLLVRSTLLRLRLQGDVLAPTFEEPVTEVRKEVSMEKKEKVSRPSTKRYVLLKKEVSWSSKPQVLALARILSAHFEVGQEMQEEDIIKACVANEDLLQTKQGGERIWKYYKGDWNEGLQAHGNIKEVK
jgi:hypothetical protein